MWLRVVTHGLPHHEAWGGGVSWAKALQKMTLTRSTPYTCKSVTLRCNMCLDFFPRCCSGGHHCLHNESILMCVCTALLSRTWECSMFYRPLLKTAKHHQYIKPNMFSILLPAGLQYDPIQMAEVVQQEYILIGGIWLCPRLNVANNVHLKKHHSYCLQSQNRGRKDRPSECHLIADDCDK